VMGCWRCMPFPETGGRQWIVAFHGMRQCDAMFQIVEAVDPEMLTKFAGMPRLTVPLEIVGVGVNPIIQITQVFLSHAAL